MTRIIEHLQTFARQRRVAQQPVNLHDVVKDAFMMLDEQLRLRNIALSWHLAADLPAIKGDAVRLEEVVINLVSNARDAMEPQGGGIHDRGHPGTPGATAGGGGGWRFRSGHRG